MTHQPFESIDHPKLEGTFDWYRFDNGALVSVLRDYEHLDGYEIHERQDNGDRDVTPDTERQVETAEEVEAILDQIEARQPTIAITQDDLTRMIQEAVEAALKSQTH